MYPPNSGPYSPHSGPAPGMPTPGIHHGPGGGPPHPIPPGEAIPQPPNELQPNSGYLPGHQPPHQPPTSDAANAGALTSVTQSITSPLSAAAPVNANSDVRLGPQPPPIMDEASQASTSSSQADEGTETPKPNSKHVSHPPTPNTLGSPGAASMSSFHDEFESVSSPSWPRTPASPVVNSQGYEHGHSVKRPDGLMKLYDMSDDPDRRSFLDKLISFNEERGSAISQCPTISKLPLDLYLLYMAVKERGGFLEVTRNKLWKECTQICKIATSSSAAYTLRKQYIKHLLPFECKFDRGGIDPLPLIQSLEGANRKGKGKNAPPPSESPFQPGQPGAPPMDAYPPSGPYTPPQSYPGQLPFGGMTNSEYPPGPHHQGPYPPPHAGGGGGAPPPMLHQMHKGVHNNPHRIQ